MKMVLKGAGFLLALAVLGVIVLMLVGTARLEARLEVPSHAVPAPAADSASLAEGARLVNVFACTECHGSQLAGTNLLDGGPFMTLPAPNLTGGRYSDEELERAIRHGVGADGRTLIVMPSEAYAAVSDRDLSQILAYIQSRPAVETVLISRSVGPVGRAVAAFQAGALQPSRSIRQDAEHVAAESEPGEYYALMCAACHGADWGGQMFAGERPAWAPNLTRHASGLAAWTEQDFEAAIRRGVRPDGRTLDAVVMPWRGFAGLTDEEVTAIWSYLGTVEPIDRPVPVDN